MSRFEKLQKAAALKYSEASGDSAPVVVASGSGCVAQKIIETAEKNGVPVFRDNSLATLLAQIQPGVEIPPELYRAVVDIYIYFLNYRTDKNGGVSYTPPSPPAQIPPEEPPSAQARPLSADTPAGDSPAERPDQNIS